MEAVVAVIEQQRAPLVHPSRAHPAAIAAVRLSPDLGVPEVVGTQALGQIGGIQHGIPGVLLIVHAVAHGHTLSLVFLALVAALLANAGVEQQLLAVRQFDGAAGKAPEGIIGRVRRQGGGQIGPMQQVMAHGMAPMHGVPLGVVGIVLIKQMVLAPVIGKAVGVVHPTHPGC